MTELLFSPEGRIGVSTFRWGIMASVFLALGIGALAWVAATAGFALASGQPLDQAAIKVIPVAQVLAGVVSGWVQVAMAAKRFHDTGRRVWWLLALLVPIVGLIWTVQELAFRQGEPQTNSFGPVPRLKMAQRK